MTEDGTPKRGAEDGAPSDDDGVARRLVEPLGRTVDRLEDLGASFTMTSSPRLERLGMRIFARREAERGPPPTDDAVHIIDEDERAEIRRISRGAILRAGFIGALAGLGCSIGALLMLAEPDVERTFWESVGAFAVVNGVVLLVTFVEVFFLYRSSLSSVHGIAHAAGIRLVPEDDDEDAAERRAVAMAMVRAALELPSPPDNPFSIDPYREISRWRVVLATLLYKLKITLTNAILRVVIRRIAGRVAIRVWLVFIDVPVTAAWDAAVAWRVIREARIRGIGPSAAEVCVGELVGDGGDVARDELEAMVRAAASGVVRSREMHPNLGALLRSLDRRIAVAEVPEIDHADRLLDDLERLGPGARGRVLEVLALALVMDGGTSRSERRFFEAAAARAGHRTDRKALRTLRRAFVRGEALSREMRRATFAVA